MNYFDNETRIIDCFQSESIRNVCLLPETTNTVNCLNHIHNSEQWSSWINSSGKSEPPPDFYSDEFQLMMEVMRIDDHTHIDEGKKLINPVNQRESKIQKEVQQKVNISSRFPNINGIFVNAITELPTYEDHNYSFYFDNYKRTIKKHITKIPLYRSNHPDFRIVFFVFDESSQYFEIDDQQKVKLGIKEGERFCGRPHYSFIDTRFLDVVKDSDIDYLIWYMPFKMTNTDHGVLKVPKACIIDIHNFDYSMAQKYNAERLMSTEA